MSLEDAAKTNLHTYLKHERAAVLAKLDGLSEYDVRRPLTITGANLLGLVKHLATWEARYLGEVFDRPWAEPLPDWEVEEELLADILREQIDGAVGTDAEAMAQPQHDADFWAQRRERIEAAAGAASAAAEGAHA